jgi:catechol 2,3-dioxygenase-like lactoylglutathione lyase family enzyme
MHPDSFFHVALKVADIEESLAFYREYFDADLIERGHAEEGEGATAVNHVALEIADKRVYLFDQMPFEATGAVEEIPVGLSHFGFVVEDIERACEELAGAVEFVMEPATFGDLAIAFFTDPSGVRIELIEHLD